MTTENIFFTSDTHFGHKNIQKFCPETRKGKDIDEHNELIIKNWCEQVKPQDRVYILGDMFFCNFTKAQEIMKRLPGQIHLILGNHDRVVESNSILRSKFASVSQYKEIRLEEIKICMFHFPIFEWHQIHHGAFHLYGHVHGSVQVPGRAMDVGIDSRPDGDMKLWTWEEVKQTLLSRELRTHHNNDMMET